MSDNKDKVGVEDREVVHLKEEKLPTYLTETEVRRFFLVCNNPRDLFLFKTLYYLGSRIGETLALVRGSWNFQEHYVRFVASSTKTKREKFSPMPDVYYKFAKNYFSIMSEMARPFNISPSRAYQLCKKYQVEAGLNKQIHPHTWRHSHAHTLLAGGAGLEMVRQALDHASIVSTSIYSRVNVHERGEVVNKVFSSDL